MTQKMRFLVTILCLSTGLQVQHAGGDVVTLGASQDNTMYSEDDLSNGSGPVMFAGRNGPGAARRALIQFDIDSEIPLGSTITSVTLTLYMEKTRDSSSFDVELHRVEATWGEGASSSGGGQGGGTGGGGGAPAEPGDATWTHRIYPDESWATTGGDFDPVASASESIGIDPAYYAWGSTAGMVSDVQSWLDDSGTNFGWLILGNEDFGETARRFSSRENSEVANRPLLTVEYTPGGSPADFTNDGYVDGDDLDIWEAAYGVDDAGDTDADTDTDGLDFLRWQIDFTGPPPPELRSVPEPAGACLLQAGLVVMFFRRYRL